MLIGFIISLVINGVLLTLCILLAKTVLIQHKIISEVKSILEEENI